MSCQIKLTGNIADIPTIRRCLFPTDDVRGSDSWLQLCKVSVSPTADTIAIANEKRIVVLTAKWDSINSLSRYDILFSGCIDNDDPIRAVLCLPVVVQTHSSQVGPEWICIVVGFESGFVRFYTDDCQLLLSEQFHTERVCNIKCQSQHSPRPDLNFELKLEEIYVQYPTVICNVNGGQLFPTLRNCHDQLGTKSDTDNSINGNGVKKLGFQDQFLINDVAVVGLDLANTFDHLLTASTCGGFDTRYRAMAPHNTLILAGGSKPFVGFHYALEGGTQPVLTDVAKAVASKLKSALPSWLTGSKASVDKQTTLAIQPAEPMGCRFGVCDLRRTATSIILSQDRRLVAVTDMLGRVLVIDCRRGLVLRMFKGYREAQCAFLQVPDEKRTKHRASTRVATFLVIYAPKKGTLEIFSAQQGLKVATFSASKFSVLLYVSYGLVGFTITTKSKYVCPFTCVLLDPDGQIKELVIPFHFALTEKNSRRARDLHLYKRLKTFIKTGDLSVENFIAEALTTCMEIKTTEVQLQCLQMLTGCRDIHPEVILKCVNYFTEKYRTSEWDDGNNDAKTLKQLLHNLNAMTLFYLFVSTNKNDLDFENGNQSVDAEPGTQTYLGEKVLNNLQKLLDLSTVNVDESTELKVSFFEDKEFNFSTFLSAFDVSRSDQISLRASVDDDTLFHISELIFKQYVRDNRNDYKDLAVEIKTCNIGINDMFKMLLTYWFNRHLHINLNLEKEMHNLSQLIYTLTKIEFIGNLSVEYNKTSPFWTSIREILADSSKPFPALTAALICRSIAQKIDHEMELQQSGTSLEDENMEIWEKMSQENCDWMILIGKLEDVSLLNIILSNRLNCSDSSLPKLKHNPVDVSLKYVLEKGKGTVSELVAQWLTTAGVSPESVILNSENTCDNSSDNLVFERLNIIRKQFPYSLDAGVLLANMCWEYAMAWQKQLHEFDYLAAAIKCLEHIPQPHLKQGLYNLVWNTHLKILFESACKLINKVGKLPKEKLCKQDTGLTDFQISSFVDVCTTFLDNFLDVVQLSYNSQKIPIRYEGIWENGGLPLAELALQQNHINYDLLHAHYQLSLTIQMITTFTVKHTKPVNNLFDGAVITLFFTDFQQKTQVSWHRSDTKIHASRTQFLLKIISASIETVSLNDSKVYANKHVHWMAKCQSLARVWNLDFDLLKRFQVIQLFLNGFDSVAEELLPSLTDSNKLGPDLLIVAGKRLHQFISSSDDLSEKIAALSPALTKYLDSLQNGEWCAPSSLEAILNVTTHCLRCLDEKQNEYKLACQLLDACATLQDIQR
ncbi:hypothetical protein RN001_012321 [Aquatica leii]|uniref:Rab3 GTPase-activating protein non-catalytic subunit n=1 Tax=Aquatica leii TaxID=1421715 RepID=A0AAN7PSR6_9COLE|nr:hypothetical protein RN001_012321 [Aquatica leii]